MAAKKIKSIEIGEIDLTSQDIVLGFGGDILITDSLLSNMEGEGVNHLFSGLNSVLSQCDIACANLETPVTSSLEKNPDKPEDLPFLRIAPKVAESFTYAPFNLFQLANNHMMDFGPSGLLETMATLEQLNIDYVGVGKDIDDARKPFIKIINGVRIAILAFSNTYYADENNPGCAPLREDVIVEDIKKIRSQCDLLIVGLHQGIVYCDYPLPEHINLARNFVDAGADIIVGHHPHVIQGAENYGGGVICYSLNGLVFDWSREEEHKEIKNSVLVKEGILSCSENDQRAREGLIMLIGVKDAEVKVQFIPVFQDYHQIPVLAEGELHDSIQQRFNGLSKALGQPELPVWDKLDKLSSIENIAGIYADGLWGNLKKVSRIRPRHFKYIKDYVLSKIS